MIEQYPREISLDEFLERRDERLLEVDADIAQPVFEIIAELDPDSPVQAVSCFGYFQEWCDRGDGTQMAEVNLLYEDIDNGFETFHFQNGYWRAPAGEERIAIQLENELIPAIGGYVLQPNEGELDDFIDRIDSHGLPADTCGMQRYSIGLGTNNMRTRTLTDRKYSCRIRDDWHD